MSNELEVFIRKDVMHRVTKVLPSSMSPDRFEAIVISQFGRTPKLWECTKESVGRAITQLAELKLECTGAIGQASLIPYKTEATLVIEYGGFITLAHRSNRVRSIYARPVFKEDTYRVTSGVHEDIRHDRYEGDDPGPLVASYAVIHYTNGGFQFETIAPREIAAIKKRLGKNCQHPDSPWKTAEPAMWAKSAIRKLSKYIPKDIMPELAQKVMETEDNLSGINGPVRDPEARVIDEGSFTAGEPEDNRGHEGAGFEAQKDRAPDAAKPETARPETEAKPTGTPPQGIRDAYQKMLDEYFGGDDQAKGEFLTELTAFDGKDGPVSGRRSLSDLSDKWVLNTVFQDNFEKALAALPREGGGGGQREAF